MKADTKFTTAIHICLYLELRGEKLLSSKEIAESVNTNPVVVRRISSALKKAGIIGSVAGKKGGFFFLKKMDQITLWDIYIAVSDRELFNKPKVNSHCPVSSNLATLVDGSFSEAEKAMQPVLERQNVAELYENLMTILDAEQQQDSLKCK
jgi:Rrf2 family protein